MPIWAASTVGKKLVFGSCRMGRSAQALIISLRSSLQSQLGELLPSNRLTPMAPTSSVPIGIAPRRDLSPFRQTLPLPTRRPNQCMAGMCRRP